MNVLSIIIDDEVADVGFYRNSRYWKRVLLFYQSKMAQRCVVDFDWLWRLSNNSRDGHVYSSVPLCSKLVVLIERRSCNHSLLLYIGYSWRHIVHECVNARGSPRPRDQQANKPPRSLAPVCDVTVNNAVDVADCCVCRRHDHQSADQSPSSISFTNTVSTFVFTPVSDMCETFPRDVSLPLIAYLVLPPKTDEGQNLNLLSVTHYFSCQLRCHFTMAETNVFICCDYSSITLVKFDDVWQKPTETDVLVVQAV